MHGKNNSSLMFCKDRQLFIILVSMFRDDLTEFKNSGVLTKLIVSFSRDVPPVDSNEAKESPKYVQDNIKIWGEELCNLIYDSGAFIFVCG